MAEVKSRELVDVVCKALADFINKDTNFLIKR